MLRIIINTTRRKAESVENIENIEFKIERVFNWNKVILFIKYIIKN